MYGYESWTIKKTESPRIYTFELWCWRRLLRIPWTERRSNQSIIKEIIPEYSLEGLMVKMKLQCFGHLLGRIESLENTLTLEKIEGRRRREWQRMRCLYDITDSMTWVWRAPGVSDGWGSLACGSLWCQKEWDTTEQLNWGQPNSIDYIILFSNRFIICFTQ